MMRTYTMSSSFNNGFLTEISIKAALLYEILGFHNNVRYRFHSKNSKKIEMPDHDGIHYFTFFGFTYQSR